MKGTFKMGDWFEHGVLCILNFPVLKTLSLFLVMSQVSTSLHCWNIWTWRVIGLSHQSMNDESHVRSFAFPTALFIPKQAAASECPSVNYLFGLSAIISLTSMNKRGTRVGCGENMEYYMLFWLVSNSAYARSGLGAQWVFVRRKGVGTVIWTREILRLCLYVFPGSSFWDKDLVWIVSLGDDHREHRRGAEEVS